MPLSAKAGPGGRLRLPSTSERDPLQTRHTRQPEPTIASAADIKYLVVVMVVVLCCVTPALSEEIVKITVRSSGTVLLDGKPTTLPALEQRFKVLKAANGQVWYHRENPPAEGPPVANAVVSLVIKYQLPVRFSARPDFSDTVEELIPPQGIAQPPSLVRPN